MKGNIYAYETVGGIIGTCMYSVVKHCIQAMVGDLIARGQVDGNAGGIFGFSYEDHSVGIYNCIVAQVGFIDAYWAGTVAGRWRNHSLEQLVYYKLVLYIVEQSITIMLQWEVQQSVVQDNIVVVITFYLLLVMQGVLCILF